MKIFFISNGSITSPILHSQGIPHLIENSKKNIQFTLFTIETYLDYTTDEYIRNRQNLLDLNINHIPIKLPRITFPSGRLWFWILGMIKVTWFSFWNKPQIIQTRSYPPMLIALFQKLLFNSKIVFDMRGIYVDELVESKIVGENSLFHKLESWLEKKYIEHSDAIISVSKKHLDFINKRYSYFNTNEKNVFIPNCPDTEKYKICKPKIKKENSLTFVYAGHFTAKYDIESMLEFFESASTTIDNCYLKILTYRDIEPFLKLINERFSHLSHLISVGKFTSQEVPSELAKSDVGIVLLHPFLSNFVSAPIKFVEYLAAGLPVIISENVGDTEEIISKYKVGSIIKNENYDQAIKELLEILQDGHIQDKCREVVLKEYNLQYAIAKYYTVYSNLANNKIVK